MECKMKAKSTNGCYILVGYEEELSDDLLDELSRTVQAKSESAPVVLFSSSTQGTCTSTRRKGVSEFFLTVYRKYLLHRNERVTVLSKEDQLVALQLVLAERQKQNVGDFDVEASSVLEMNEHIKNLKTDAHEQESAVGCRRKTPPTPEHEEVFSLYQEFLSHSNYSDFMDVYTAVTKELEHNESLQKELKDQSFLLVISSQDNYEEMLMLELLCKEAPVYEIKMASCLGSLDNKMLEISVTESTLPSIMERFSKGDNSSQRSFTSPQKSATESFINSTIMSYLELLVNSRSEMALARVINTPHRDLDHTAFTELKRYAKTKNMPMYQTVLSFITKLRLGGKGYAPDTTCALAQHVKGIGDFSDLMQKLQTIVEEDLDTRSACRRVVNVLKNTFLKNKENRLRRSSIESATEQIQSSITAVITLIDQYSIVTPEKPAGSGGTLVGRQSVRVIRMLLDQEATKPSSGYTANIFGDLFSSQKTPVHFPCLLSKFRSPEEVVDDKLNQSLTDRMKAKIKKHNMPKNNSVRYKSGMDWAVPLHGTPNRDDGICKDNQVIVMPSKTLVQPGENTIIGLSVASRVLESMNDQENRNHQCKKSSKQTKPAEKRIAEDSGVSVDNNLQVNAPSEDSSSQPPSKKRKLPAEKPKKAVRRKLIPQVKGQQSLTKFFRV